MLWERLSPGGGHPVSKKLHLGHSELALLQVEHEAKLPELGEELAKGGDVQGHGRVGDHQVVHIAECGLDLGDGDVHSPLERLSGVPESEGHAAELPESKRRCHRRFRDVSFLHRDLVVPLLQIQFAEDTAPGQLG